MRLVSFDDYRVGVQEGDLVHDVTAVLPDLPEELWPQRFNVLIEKWNGLERAVRDLVAEGHGVPLETVTLLTPNPSPRQVFALPANFRQHIGELADRAVTKGGRSAREQGFFVLAPGSLGGPQDDVLLPHGSERRFDHEVELAVFIAKSARDIPRDAAMEYVFGYSVLLDATMRIEKGIAEEERSMRKSFAGFTPVGPAVITADEINDVDILTSTLRVNGETRQAAPLSEMIVGIGEAIELISSVVELKPGDIVAMGTPSGVGPIEPGDAVTLDIERVGTLELAVGERAAASPRAY